LSLTIEEKRAHGEALIDLLNARDFDGLRASPWFDDENSIFRSALAASEGEVYRGIRGLREWAANVEAVWDDFHIEIAEHHEVDADRSLTVFNITGRAKASGVPLALRTAQIWTWRDGAMVENDSFTDPREGFEAAGIPYDPSTRSR
jgi:ketosteroid isomerase-like protein